MDTLRRLNKEACSIKSSQRIKEQQYKNRADFVEVIDSSSEEEPNISMSTVSATASTVSQELVVNIFYMLQYVGKYKLSIHCSNKK